MLSCGQLREHLKSRLTLVGCFDAITEFFQFFINLDVEMFPYVWNHSRISPSSSLPKARLGYSPNFFMSVDINVDDR